MARLWIPAPIEGAVASVKELRALALWPLLLRLGVFVCADVAVVLAAPLDSLAGNLTMAAVAVVPALATALFVNARWVLAFQVLVMMEATFGLAARTDTAGWAGSRWPQLVGLACMLYLVHTCAAMAGALPLSTDVHPDVLVRLGRRLALVLGATVVVGLLIALIDAAVGGHAPPVVPLVGLLLATAVTLVPAVLLRRG